MFISQKQTTQNPNYSKSRNSNSKHSNKENRTNKRINIHTTVLDWIIRIVPRLSMVNTNDRKDRGKGNGSAKEQNESTLETEQSSSSWETPWTSNKERRPVTILLLLEVIKWQLGLGFPHLQSICALNLCVYLCRFYSKTWMTLMEFWSCAGWWENSRLMHLLFSFSLSVLFAQLLLVLMRKHLFCTTNAILSSSNSNILTFLTK